MHHRRRSLILLVVVLLLAVLVGGCSGDDEAGGAGGPGSPSPEGSTRPTDSIVPGGSAPTSDGTGSTTTSTTTGAGSGDPSEGIPRDQFCRGFGQVRLAESDMAGALDADDVARFKTAYARLADAYLAIAENPPDEVYDEVRAVYFLYDDLGAQVAGAQSTGELTDIALEVQNDERAEDLEAVRDYGAANC